MAHYLTSLKFVDTGSVPEPVKEEVDEETAAG